MVVDTSVILSIYLNEPTAAWCLEQLQTEQRLGQRIYMSTVSLAEVMIRAHDLAPHQLAQLEEQILSGSIEFVPPDIEQAKLAATARASLPLNLGDCFVYALAKSLLQPILTLDKDFKNCGLKVVLP